MNIYSISYLFNTPRSGFGPHAIRLTPLVELAMMTISGRVRINIHFSTKDSLQTTTTTRSLVTDNFGDAEMAWNTWTLRFNIALTKIIICFTIFTDSTTVLTFTHMKSWQKGWWANIYCTRELQKQLTWSTVRYFLFLQDKNWRLRAGTIITLFTLTSTSLS